MELLSKTLFDVFELFHFCIFKKNYIWFDLILLLLLILDKYDNNHHFYYIIFLLVFTIIYIYLSITIDYYLIV